MPATRARTGLSESDLDAVRAALAAGRRPKVMFTADAGQIAGQLGQVVRLDDPTADEWVVVRFGRDELPFAPSDVQLPPARPRTSARAAPRAASAAMPSPAAAAVTPSVSAAVPPAASPAWTPSPSVSDTPKESVVEPKEPNGETPKKAPRKGAKRPVDLAVTLTWHEGSWTVQAARGARTIAKPAPVRAADALDMVRRLDSPAVAEAVEEIVAAARADAEEQAEQLRQRLAEVEAALADLREVRQPA